ncbi:MAG: PaaI family thioesterase [Halobacteriales archaeon]
MDLSDIMGSLPYMEFLGIEVVEAEDGRGVVEVEMTDELSSNPGRHVAHGAVPYALADTAGGAAVVSLTHGPSPTVDMRIDYLNPMTDDARAEAEVVRMGRSTAVVDATVSQGDVEVARARGVYKAGTVESGSPHDFSAEEFAGD